MLRYAALVPSYILLTCSSQLHPSLENFVQPVRDRASFLCASSYNPSQSSLQPVTRRFQRLLLAKKLVHLINSCSNTLLGIGQKLDSWWDNILPKLLSLACSGALIPSSIEQGTWILDSGSVGWKPHRAQRLNTPLHLWEYYIPGGIGRAMEAFFDKRTSY